MGLSQPRFPRFWILKFGNGRLQLFSHYMNNKAKAKGAEMGPQLSSRAHQELVSIVVPGSNLAIPSGADWVATDRLRTILHSVGLTLMDHIVFADDDAVSLKATDLYGRRASYDVT